jgi:hypothetical protein
VTYQMLLERMAATPPTPPAPPAPIAPAVPTPPERRGSCTSTSSAASTISDGSWHGSSGMIEPPAHAAETLAALEAERARAEEATRAMEAEAELATKQLIQCASSIENAEMAREAAECAAEADRMQREAVAEKLSDVNRRMEQLESDLRQRIRDAKADEAQREADEAQREAAAGAAADAADAAEAARLMQLVAELEISVRSKGEELDSAEARRRAEEEAERQAIAEEEEMRQSIEDLKRQQEQDEHNKAEHEAELSREQQKRDLLEQNTSELEKKRGKVDSDLEQLGVQAAPSLQNVKGGKSAAEVGGTSTDPNGIEPLVGEDESSYVSRQLRVRQEAKERMAAKFGSGGLAQGQGTGVGSNPSSDSSAASAVPVPVPASASAPPPVPVPAPSADTGAGRNSPTLPPSSGWLHVTVIACSNILAADPSGRSDPFIKLCLGGEERLTTPRQKTLNPVFNETLTLPIDVAKDHVEQAQQGHTTAGLSSDTFLLRVEVWDKDRHSRDDFLGECSVHLLDLYAGVWCDRERPVHCPFEDPQRRLSARERKQAKQRGGAQPCGAVDLRCTFEAKTAMPSLAEWLAERDLTTYTQRVTDAMIKAEVPDEEVVPMLAGMDDLELDQFIEACAQSQSKSKSQPRSEPEPDNPTADDTAVESGFIADNTAVESGFIADDTAAGSGFIAGDTESDDSDDGGLGFQLDDGDF